MAGIRYSRFYPIGIFKPTPRKALQDNSMVEAIDLLLKKDGVYKR